MASSATRRQIVTDALSLAGRSLELQSSANQWLNYFLNHVAQNFRFPALRKIGTPLSLPMGTNTVALPTDFGAGMEKQGMIFGSENKPMDEAGFEDFAINTGFPPSGATGRPTSYIVDKEAGMFRFNRAADQNYGFTPVYFKLPTNPDVSAAGDSDKLWIDNDLICVQGCIWFIYQFTGDQREGSQGMIVDRLIGEWKRELVKIGGTSRIVLSPNRFKNTRFGGFNGP